MMMKDLSLHVMDIAQNSIVAGASVIRIIVKIDQHADRISISVEDNGCGMDAAMVEAVVSPFTTSRTTRKVGLGIPMFKAGAESCDGDFELSSKPGEGTYISASYRISHLDRPPLGDMAETILALVVCNPDLDFIYEYIVDEKEYLFDTRMIRDVLGHEVALNLPEVAAWIRDYLKEGINELNGGVLI